MKSSASALVMAAIAVSVCFSVPAAAADRIVMLPIITALNSPEALARLGDSPKFYFGAQAIPPVAAELGEGATNKKTSAFGKSDEQACNWVFLSAMLQLKKRAEELGADAVVNIVSNYKRSEMSSETEVECHAGTMMAGVALKGDFVKLK